MQRRTFRSMTSLFLVSRSLFRDSTSALLGCGFDSEPKISFSSIFSASFCLASSFAGAASEYHLESIRVLDGWIEYRGIDRNGVDIIRPDGDSCVLRDREARKKFRCSMINGVRVA